MPPADPKSASLRREFAALLVLYLALAIVPVLLGLLTGPRS